MDVPTHALSIAMAFLGPMDCIRAAVFQTLQYPQRESETFSISLDRQPPDPQEETFEEQEKRPEKEATPATNISSSSLDEAVMPSLLPNSSR